MCSVCAYSGALVQPSRQSSHFLFHRKSTREAPVFLLCLLPLQLKEANKFVFTVHSTSSTISVKFNWKNLFEMGLLGFRNLAIISTTFLSNLATIWKLLYLNLEARFKKRWQHCFCLSPPLSLPLLDEEANSQRFNGSPA